MDGDSRDVARDTPPVDVTDTNPSPDMRADLDAEIERDGDADTSDTGVDAEDADAADADTAGSDGSCLPGRTSPPTTVCQGGHCLTLSPVVRSGVALWLDPSNLGPVGTDVTTWCDQSGQMNDALNFDVAAVPQVIPGGIALPYGTLDAAFVVGDGPSIDLGADDFLILVVAGISHGTQGKSLFRKFNGDAAFPKQVALEWISQPGIGFRVTGEINETTGVSSVATDAGPVRLYGLRRANDQMEVRVNGQIVSSVPLATPGASTESDGNDVFIGEIGYGDPTSVDTLHAAVVIRGVLDSTEVAKLETYLVTAFGL
jgi:hypothetical protein